VVVPTDDVDLLKRLRDGDQDAFATVVEQWSPTMLRVARSYVRTTHAAEDVVQDTWVGVITGLDRFEGRSSLRSWVFAILVNQACTYARRASRTVPWTEPEATHPTHWTSLPAQVCDQDPERSALLGELSDLLVDALTHLPPRQALSVTLRDIVGVDAEDACALMSVSSQNHRVLLHRGRAAVRAPLAAYLSA
jgi:RNA polymerase sigma-70 factor (ECF subfamily)